MERLTLVRTLAAGVIILLGSATASPRQSEEAESTIDAIELPPELRRVLTDYENGWRAQDAPALAQLFTEDGFVLSPGRPPVRGRAAIEARYEGSGGPLFLHAYAYAVDGELGYIIGGYTGTEGAPDSGKFTLTLRKGSDGRWLIASDMDNGNHRDR